MSVINPELSLLLLVSCFLIKKSPFWNGGTPNHRHRRCPSISENAPKFWKSDNALTNHLNFGPQLIFFGSAIYVACSFCKKKLPKSAKYDHGSCSKKRLPRTGGHHPFFQSQHHSNRETGTSMYLQMAHPFAPHRFEVPVEHLATCLTHCRASGGLQSKIWRQF